MGLGAGLDNAFASRTRSTVSDLVRSLVIWSATPSATSACVMRFWASKIGTAITVMPLM